MRKSLVMTALLAVLLASGLTLPEVGWSQTGDGASSGVVTLVLIPTGVAQSQELRINTGRKANLADGSYNTVYEHKTPKPEHVFLEIDMDVSVENGPLVLDGSLLRLQGDVAGTRRDYRPIDWYRDEGLTEARGDTLRIPGLASVQATFEIPREEVEKLTFWLGGLRVGSIPGILSRVGSQD